MWAGVGLVRGGAGTALVVMMILRCCANRISLILCFLGYPEKAYPGWRVAVPASDIAIPEIPQPQPLNPQAKRWQMILYPSVKSRKAKENNGNASESGVRCPGFFTVGITWR